MTTTEPSSLINRYRAAITARSVLANLDVFTDQGLCADRRLEATRLARSLSGPTAQLDDPDAAAQARELRALMVAVPGPTAAVLVRWFDDALTRAV